MHYTAKQLPGIAHHAARLMRIVREAGSLSRGQMRACCACDLSRHDLPATIALDTCVSEGFLRYEAGRYHLIEREDGREHPFDRSEA